MFELHFFSSICVCTFQSADLLFSYRPQIGRDLHAFEKKKNILFFDIMYKHNYIFLNFGVISFTNKEVVSVFQLHIYNCPIVSLK